MDNKTLIISIVAIVGFVIVSYFAFNKPAAPAIPLPEQATARAEDHRKGTGKKLLVEYSDLQCPACKTFHEYLETQKKSDPAFAKLMNEKYTFVYRHFPLTSIHKNAQSAAYHAEAAAKQGKFYEFIDRAFATQTEWSDLDKPEVFFMTIATDLGLDLSKFSTDASTDGVKNQVQTDSDLALRGGVNSTPTFFIDGVKLSGYNSFDDFKQLLIDRSASVTTP